MKILNTNKQKEKLISGLSTEKIKNKLLILTMNPTEEEISYKNFIMKRCKDFNISYEELDFDPSLPENSVVEKINSYNDEDGFIVLLPFDNYAGLDYMRENIKLKDIDGFTYSSLGKIMNGEISSLPATPKAIGSYLEAETNLVGKNIVIANNTSLIGLPLANYLSSRGATVTILNEYSHMTKCFIREADIFMSAIGKANFYNRDYFKDGQLLIDVGTSYVNGKIVGDINYEDLEDLDVEILTSKGGIGAITTLTLLESLRK